jgi:hypothetical protein
MSVSLTFAPWARLGIGAALNAQAGALRAQVAITAQVGGRIGNAAAPAWRRRSPHKRSVPAMSGSIGGSSSTDPRTRARADAGGDRVLAS